jgi:hypothetical protein
MTLTFGEVPGFGVEYNTSGLGQKYDIKNGNETYLKYLKVKTSDLIVFFRLSSEAGGYFEIGPKFSTIKKMSVSNNIDKPFRPEDNIKDSYLPKYTSIMIGAGLSPVRTDRFALNIGFRGAYAFSDIVTDHNHFILNDFFYQPNYLPSNAKTNPFTLQALVEFEYFFAYFGKAACGRGGIQFFR